MAQNENLAAWDRGGFTRRSQTREWILNCVSREEFLVCAWNRREMLGQVKLQKSHAVFFSRFPFEAPADLFSAARLFFSADIKSITGARRGDFT
jgi:hypothetical protein